MTEETKEKGATQAEMGPDSQGHQDPPDLQDKSSTSLQAAEDLVCPVMLDSLAQWDQKETKVNLDLPDTEQRERKVNLDWSLDLTGHSCVWMGSQVKRARGDLQDVLDLLVHRGLRELRVK